MDPQRLAIDCSFHDLEIQNSKESKHPHLVARIVRGDRANCERLLSDAIETAHREDRD